MLETEPGWERGETFRLKHEELGSEAGVGAGVDWCELDISRYSRCCLVCTGQGLTRTVVQNK